MDNIIIHVIIILQESLKLTSLLTWDVNETKF